MTTIDLRRTAPPPRLRLPGLHKASAVYLLAFVMVLFSLWIPDTFLSSTTFRVVGADQVVVGILALALLIPLVTGVFDLSVGAMLAFSLVIVSWLEVNTGINAVLSCLIALAACAVVGAITGFIVVRFRVDSFIATLGMSQVLASASLYTSQNKQITSAFSPRFLQFGRRDLLGIPIVIYYLVVVGVLVWYVLEHTSLGRHMFATGANPEAARLSGVRTDRMVWGSLITSAVVAGFAGIVFGAKVGSYSNTFGPPLLFPAFAAVFFGASQFKSRPNVWGTVLAVYTLAFGVKGLQLAFSTGVYWITPLFNGIAVVVAVALASRRVAASRRRRSLDADQGPSGSVTAEFARSMVAPAERDGSAMGNGTATAPADEPRAH
jgi:ribose transport system permease protein